MSATPPNKNALVESVLSAVGPHLTAGLDAPQAGWAVEALRRVVLPFRLRSGNPDLLVDLVAKDLNERIASLAPPERWTQLVEEYYGVRVQVLSTLAFELALERQSGAHPLQAIEQDAAEGSERLERLLAEMRDHAPGPLGRLADEISEATLDFLYAEGGGDVTSLRLAHALE